MCVLQQPIGCIVSFVCFLFYYYHYYFGNQNRSLSGLGVARQRKAIVQGLQASVAEFSDQVEGATPKDVMDILLLSQYFDTLSAVGANQLFLEHDPATVAHLQQSVGRSFANAGKKK